MSTGCCPTCGTYLRRTVRPFDVDMDRFIAITADGRTVGPMSRRFFVILDALNKAHPRGVLQERLVDALYEDDPDNSPLDAINCVQVAVCNLRKHLKGSGWAISKRRHSPYILERTTDAVSP